ncbi:MAG: chemotaxis protein CheB, partial [Deltaproteobacteria bacterium]
AGRIAKGYPRSPHGSPNFAAGITNPLGKPKENGRARAPSLLICIGSSTGGIEVLERILPEFPADFPPVVIVQHISAEFAPGLARRLGAVCAGQVAAGQDGMKIRNGQVVLAAGNKTHLRLKRRRGVFCSLEEEPPVMGHRPSIDVLFTSAASTGLPIIAALLTGMGSDGVEGMLRIRSCAGRTIAQDAASSKVFGMPRRAIERGAAEFVLPADEIGPKIVALARIIEAKAATP